MANPNVSEIAKKMAAELGAKCKRDNAGSNDYLVTFKVGETDIESMCVSLVCGNNFQRQCQQHGNRFLNHGLQVGASVSYTARGAVVVRFWDIS